MFARISIVYDRHEQALQVPRVAVVGEGDERAVFVVEDGQAVRKTVQTGFSEKGMIEVTAGLADQERVITVGQVGLKDGAKVTIINAGQASSVAGDATSSESDDAPTD